MLGYYGTVCPAVRSTCPEMGDDIFSTKQQCIASLGIEPVARSLNIVEYGVIWLTILEKMEYSLCVNVSYEQRDSHVMQTPTLIFFLESGVSSIRANSIWPLLDRSQLYI